MTQPAPAYKPLTRAQQKLLMRADEIWEKRAGKKDTAYIARQLIQATLPHKSPGNIPVWSRTNGNLTLSVTPYIDRKTGKSLGYPFGTIPRLLLFWMTTEALKTGSRRLELGGNLAAFMIELGLNPDNGSAGAKRSDARRLKNQMYRLFRSTISFDIDKTKGGRAGTSWLDMQVAPKGEIWWDTREPWQDDIWDSWIEMGEDFYQSVISSPVPVDMRALKALKNSALGLDLYAWLTLECYKAHRKNEQRFVSWDLLNKQFGSDYINPKKFGVAARVQLKKIKIVYPDLILGDKRGGIEILPGSMPAILPQS